MSSAEGNAFSSIGPIVFFPLHDLGREMKNFRVRVRFILGTALACEAATALECGAATAVVCGDTTAGSDSAMASGSDNARTAGSEVALRMTDVALESSDVALRVWPAARIELARAEDLRRCASSPRCTRLLSSAKLMDSWRRMVLAGTVPELVVAMVLEVLTGTVPMVLV